MSLVSDAPLVVLGEVLIAGEKTKRHRSLPGAQCLPGGELLVAFRSGRDKFVTDDGAVVLVRSQDSGKTWSGQIPLLAEPGWDCHGGSRLVQLDDETLLMLLGKARWVRKQNTVDSNTLFQARPQTYPAGTTPARGSAGETHREFSSFSTRSSDGSRTWSQLGPSIKLFPVWTEPYVHRAIKLSDGRLMIGFHGSSQPDAPTFSGVAFSRDQGNTWVEFVSIARAPHMHFYEVELLRLPSRGILAIIRTNDPPPYDSYQSVSVDEDATWTSLKKTGFCGHCPCLFQLNPSILLGPYRDLAPGRPGISISMSQDEGQSWRWLG